MDRQPSKSLRKGNKAWELPELDLSEELADDWDLSPTKEREIQDHCQAQVQALIAGKYAAGWDRTPKGCQGATGKTAKLWEGLKIEVNEKLKLLRRLQVMETEQAQLLQQHSCSLSASLNLTSLLSSSSLQLYFLPSTSLVSESDCYEHVLSRTFSALQRAKDKVSALKQSTDVMQRKIAEGKGTVLALETECQSTRNMMETYAGHVASISHSIRRKIDGKCEASRQDQFEQGQHEVSQAAQELISFNVSQEKARFQQTDREQKRREKQAQRLALQAKLMSEEYHEDSILRQVSLFSEVFGSTEPDTVCEKYWDKVDTGLSLKREVERSERRKMDLIRTFEGLKRELEEEKTKLDAVLRDETVERLQKTSQTKLTALFTNEIRLKETNQTLIHVVFGLMTSLAKLTKRDFSEELGPNLSFSVNIDSSQLGQITETAEMLNELPRFLLLLGKKFTTAYEIAYQRRHLRSYTTRIIVKSQKSRKIQVPNSPVSRLKQEFESLLRPSICIANVEPLKLTALPQTCAQETFPAQLLPPQAKLQPSQSLDRLKAHSSSPRRSGSLTDRTPQAQQFTRTLLCINKDLSLLSSRQQRTPRQVTSFTEMLGSLHKRQLRLAAFHPRDLTEASTIETSRGRPGLTPLSKASSLSPFHPTYRPRLPFKLPLFP